MDGYSRIVAFLKVLLPLAALVLLSTLFLISRGTNTETSIPFAEQEIEERLRDQQVTAPFFSGTTAQGDEIMFTAARARPGSAGGPAEAEDIKARLRTISGSEMNIRSDSGQIRMDTDVASLLGNVEITSSTGVHVTSDALNAALSGIEGNSPGPVAGTGPFGEFTAGSMHFSSKNGDGPIHMLFNKGVKLIYTPQKQER